MEIRLLEWPFILFAVCVFQERHAALEKMGISVQTSGIKVEQGRYYLVNLNADPSLNELLVYYLKVGNWKNQSWDDILIRNCHWAVSNKNVISCLIFSVSEIHVTVSLKLDWSQLYLGFQFYLGLSHSSISFTSCSISSSFSS